MWSTPRLDAYAQRLAMRLVYELPAARRLRFQLVGDALERFASGRALHVLDAGAGEGLLTEKLARRHPSWQIVAADLSEELLQKGRARVEDEGMENVRLVHADLTKDLGDSLYDAVVAVECLEEIPDDDAALAAMARALRPDGLFLAHVPEREWRPVLPWGAHTWRLQVRHGYHADEIALKCERAGLRDVVVTPTARGTVWAAQELADRLKAASLKARALPYVLSSVAVRLERWGVTWGEPHALFVEARR
jgi:ubiquinone/menaquinone biosynthesis C-methylase UbiE